MMMQTVKHLFAEIAEVQAILLFIAFLVGYLAAFVTYVHTLRVIKKVHSDFIATLTAVHEAQVKHLQEELKAANDFAEFENAIKEGEKELEKQR